MPFLFPLLGGVAALPARPDCMGLKHSLSLKRVAKFGVSQVVHTHSASFGWCVKLRHARCVVKISLTSPCVPSLGWFGMRNYLRSTVFQSLDIGC